MTKRIEHIECDCRQGKLEEIARTNEIGGPIDNAGEYGIPSFEPYKKSLFYECDKCQKLYQEDVSDSRGEIPSLRWSLRSAHSGKSVEINPNAGMNWRELGEYRGKLTRDQIINYAKNMDGHLDAYGEGVIMALEDGTINDYVLGGWKKKVNLVEKDGRSVWEHI